MRVLDLSVWYWQELKLYEFFGSYVFAALSDRKCNFVLLVVYLEKMQEKLSEVYKSPKLHKTLTEHVCF